MIKLLGDTSRKILEHSEGAYPNECCGALIGKNEGGKNVGGKTVIQVCPLKNINKERSRDRYEIDPAELLKIEKDARGRGLEVVGFYHSHPDHPARPSTFDRERGWPGYSYIIVSVVDGGTAAKKSWTFSEFDEPFKEEKIVVEA